MYDVSTVMDAAGYQPPLRRATAIPLTVTAMWSRSDPLAVTLRIADPTSGDGTDWLMARELLLVGVSTPTGRGDVQVQPLGVFHVGVRISSPSGTLVIRLSRQAVVAFVRETERWVPVGEEVIEVPDSPAPLFTT